MKPTEPTVAAPPPPSQCVAPIAGSLEDRCGMVAWCAAAGFPQDRMLAYEQARATCLAQGALPAPRPARATP